MSIYLFPTKTVESDSVVYFDGSDSESDAIQVNEITGNFNARIYLERKKDEKWVQVTQYKSGNLKDNWNTKEIQPIISKKGRRLKIYNKDNKSGSVEMVGEVK